MAKNIKVASIVHNPVLGDARVRKEALTLSSAGYEVTVFGYGAEKTERCDLDGAKLHVLAKLNQHGLLSKIKRYKNRLASVSKLAGFSAFLVSLTIIVLLSILDIERRTVFSIAMPALAIASLSTSFALARLLLLFRKIPFPHIISLLTLPAFILIVRPQGIFSYVATSFYLAGILLSLALPILKKRIGLKLKKNAGVAAKKFGYERISDHLANEVLKQNWDAIHTHDIIGLMAGIKIKKKKPLTPLIWDAHELYTELAYNEPGFSEHVDNIIRDASKNVDRFVTISESFRSIYHERYPKLPKAYVLPNATRVTTQEISNSGKIRNACQIKSDQLILLFQGGFSESRGIRKLLAAGKNIPINWTIVFMGSRKLLEEIENAGFTTNKHRPTNQPAIKSIPPAPYLELASWTCDATVGIIPYEPTSMNQIHCMPNKLWEYPNAGIPIIATALVEMSKIIIDNNIGVLIPPDFSPQDILNSLEAFEDPTEYENLRSNCLRFNQIENWEKYEAGVLEMYEEICK